MYHIFKYSKIFDFHSSRVKWLVYLLLIIPMIVVVVIAITISNMNRSVRDDDSKYYKQISTLMWSDYTEVYIIPSILIFANLLLFFLCWYHSSKILHPIQMSSRIPDHVAAMGLLVKRMKYYPLIQCTLLVMMILAYFDGQFYNEYINMLIPISALSYLVLFLTMQPFALDHLKYRLGLGGKRVSPVKARSQHDDTTTSAGSTTTKQAGLSSSMDADLVVHDNMEDDELSSIIDNSSSAGSGSHNVVGDVIIDSQL